MLLCFQIGSVKVCSQPLTGLETITDNAMDCTYLIVTAESRLQWRVLLEQRSTGYAWCCSGERAATSGPSPPAAEEAAAPVQGLSKSRLSGLKQISAAGLANLRQRISEGKRLLVERKVSSSTSSSNLSTVEVGEEATEAANDSEGGSSEAEPLSSKIGETFVSVQRTSKLQILAGVFPGTAVLTIHNCELEVMPQSAYKLPRGTERILLLNKVMLVSTTTSATSDGTSARPYKRGCVHVVSSHHAEIHLDGNNSKSDSVFQTFTLSPNERVLGILSCGGSNPSSSKPKDTSYGSCDQTATAAENIVRSEEGNVTSQTSSPSSSSSLSSSSKGGISNPLLLQIGTNKNCDEFAQRIRARLEITKLKGLRLFNNCLLITTQALYLIQIDQDPVSVFMELAMRGAELRKAEQLSISFGLDMKQLLEMAADIRLCERDFTNAISLYRLAGCKHLKVVLKFAESGHIQELLSYLTVLFKTPNLDLTPEHRIHMTNLALMAFFQQILTKNTPMTRAKFQAQIREFLDENGWYDECLSIRMATETKEWNLLGHISRSKGLNYEMVESILSVLLGSEKETVNGNQICNTLQEMNASDRNCLLGCLLRVNNMEAVMTSPELIGRLISVLNGVVGLLEEQGLLSVLAVGPDNPALRPIYLSLLEQEGGRKSQAECLPFAVSLVNLFISASLLLLKKRGRSASGEVIPKKYLSEERSAFGERPTKQRHRRPKRKVISAGAAHVLLQRKGTAISWGMTNYGVLGNGATGLRFQTPKEVAFFKSAKIQVFSVACGKAHSMALTDNGLYTWGSSKHGQLGLGVLRCSEQRPALVKAFADRSITAIAAGQYHSVALDREGSVWTWGWGVHGQLGTRDIEDVFEPTRVFRRKETVVQIGAGYAHTLLLTSKGEVWVFGCALFGQLGNGDNKKATAPIRIEGLPNRVRLISCGFFHNICVDEEDAVYTWGCNPQVLRLEAQQKKRERLQSAKREMEAREKDKQQPGHHQQQQQQQETGALPSGNSNSIFRDIKKQARQAFDDIRNYDGNQQSSPGKDKAKSLLESADLVTKPDDDDMLHLVPGLLECKGISGKIVSVSCGNQHSMFLTDTGFVYTYGRNMDGQLGISSRKESKVPVAVTALKEDPICQIACGGDYSLAVSESGTVFAWGNNNAGQLGKVPLDESSGGVGTESKVVVMKTTRRIIRLQNNLQNSCDIPKPVSGITNGVYSDDVPPPTDDTTTVNGGEEDNADHNNAGRGLDCDNDEGKLLRTIKLFQKFNNNKSPAANVDHVDDENVERLLHLTLEAFFLHLEARSLVKKCLVSDNANAAAKLSLLSGNTLQAFEFTLQLIIRQSITCNNREDATTTTGNLVCERIFKSFLLYLDHTRTANESRERRQLLERLIACWQDQKFSFVLLEKLFLQHSEQLLLQTLVLTLFCPEAERDTNRGPVLGEEFGPKLSDLFTPEFCLKIGDTFVKEIKEEKRRSVSSLDDRASMVAGEWLRKKQQEREGRSEP